ncbi:hypothetical protein DEO72_LG8g542 [Vigna unguiculata]|uniref:Uncharacterized protein n=1 Tax=Vigna unguiculata TaxID=3917 RepID=A0A4D6MNF2_VIGUN|nr:hypothetical protein DEO72_LG8g541 [Vigna unguiculata]QCE02528.1 hypothetical protein DEO72_LG8g542 [Vigna unguiculata]
MPNEIPIRPWPRLASLYSPAQSHLASQTTEESRNKGIRIELSDSDKGNGIRMVTVAGKNRGAKMQTNQSQKKRLNMSVVYANSIVQCISNSMVFNSSCTHRNPGMNLITSEKPFGQG